VPLGEEPAVDAATGVALRSFACVAASPLLVAPTDTGAWVEADDCAAEKVIETAIARSAR